MTTEAITLRVLYVEDNPVDADLTRRELARLAQEIRLESVTTLGAAMERLTAERPPFDIILTDLSLPDGSGLELLAHVRERELPLAVVIVTGSGDQAAAVAALKAGADDYLVKRAGHIGNLPRVLAAAYNGFRTRRERRTRFLRVLYAEPNVFDIDLTRRHLTQNAPHIRLEVAGSGEEALARLSLTAGGAPPFDVLLLDYQLPGLNALEVVKTLRQEQGLEIPIVLITGHGCEELAVQCLRLGVDDYLVKHEGYLQQLPAVLEKVQKQAELNASEERFQLAMQGANEGLWDWNVTRDEVYFAPRWKTMLGYADEELKNHFDTWQRLVHPDDMEPAMARVRDFLEGRVSRYENEFRMRHKDGHYLNILARGFPVYDDQGKAVRMVGTHLDITEQKKLEEQFRQAQKMEAIGQLAGGIAHDFNNILSAILGYSQLSLNKLKGNDPVKEYVEQILKASERAAVLTRSLLAFSRKQSVVLTVIDFDRMVKEFEEFLRRLIREDIELKISCTGEPLVVRADRGQIEQVIMNLVTNARDAMPAGGRLTIEALAATLDQKFIETHGYGKAGVYALISVSDSGVGMDKETQLRIFEPFYTTKEQGKGTGLGLSMAYGIVKKHDGFIDVFSEPGKGTTFNIYLPLVEALVQERETKEAASLRGGAETILVCEDDAELRKLAVNVLSYFGYRVIEAVDGEDAIEKFVVHQEKIDLVFIDAIMPKKNGKVASDEMKTMRPDLKTIFVSGYTRDIFEEGNTFDDNTAFLHKPYSPNELAVTVREMLDRK